MWTSPKIGAIAFLHWTVKLMFGLSMADFKQLLLRIPHHAGWLTSNMLLLQHTDLGSMFSLYRTIKTAAFCNHEISDVSTVLGIPEEARKKNTSSEEFSTNIGDEKPAKMRIEPTN
jgi:hypothetical protein